MAAVGDAQTNYITMREKGQTTRVEVVRARVCGGKANKEATSCDVCVESMYGDHVILHRPNGDCANDRITTNGGYRVGGCHVVMMGSHWGVRISGQA